MQCFNSLQKYDLNGLIYSGVVYDRPVIKIDSRGSQRVKRCISDERVENDNEGRSVRRSKITVKDYVKTNPDLKYFVTYTLAPDKVDRHSEEEIYKRVRSWLMNNVSRKGLKYIPVWYRKNIRMEHGTFMVLLISRWSGSMGFVRLLR